MSVLSEEVLQNHRRLSPASERFVRVMVADVPRRDDLVFDPDALPELVRNYQYEVNPWPMFVGGSTLRSFERAAISLPELLRKAFDPYASEYFRRVVECYKMTSGQIDKLLAVDVRPHLVTRSDSVLTAGGIKTVELNLGSKVGGWQIQFFDRAYRGLPGLQKGFQQCGAFASHDILEAYLRSLVGACRGIPTFGGEEVQLLFLVDDATSAVATAVVRHLEVLAARLGLRVRIRVDDGVEGIAESRGVLTYDGAQLHSLVVTQGLPSYIPECVFEAYYEGRLVWPDNPVCDALNEKKLFESFFRAQPPSGLTSQELELARSILPTCVPLSQPRVVHGGSEMPTNEYLERYQQDLVLKLSYSAQGRGVHVGRHTGAGEWRQLLRDAIGSDTWTAQEYCESLRFCSYDKVHGRSAIFSCVFGLFSFAGNYGGTWVRMIEDGKTSTGIINSAQGAQEAIVYACGN